MNILEKINDKLKTAVIIRGNPKRLLPGNLYQELENYLVSKGYDVQFDDGLPYTEPPAADLWVGHSRGADRLRFAPKGTTTIAVGSGTDGAINHPDDVQTDDPEDFDKLPMRNKKAHNSWHPNIGHELDKIIR